MYTVRPTQKLLARVRQPVTDEPVPTTNLLGDWYANALFWRPHLALFVNEATLFPVLVPLSPAATVFRRFPEELGIMMATVGISPLVIRQELAATTEVQVARTTNRSTLAVMVETARMALRVRDMRSWTTVDLALNLADRPHRLPNTIWPIDELHALVASRAALS